MNLGEIAYNQSCNADKILADEGSMLDWVVIE
jgi:hypothetical protein